MSCPACGATVADGQRFCGACGAKVARACPACGTENPPGFAFCGGCGATLASGAPLGDERRVVTVLFADLVDFTGRAERLDPEDVRALLTPYHAAVRDQIEAFGGVVEKFIGDAVVGVFGAPVAHGDDPERAVRAALEILARVDLDVRVGINTGETIATLDAKPSEGEGMVAGDVINTAARLQSAAAANTILVGDDTYRCTSGVIDYDAIGPLPLKGKELPVAAWRVRGAVRAPGERAASTVGMVGRADELATLLATWDDVAAERRPQLVTVTGQAGVGKSRLTAEFTTTLRERGARVVFGRSVPYGDRGAYDAFAQQITQIVGAGTLRETVAGLVDADAVAEVTGHLELMLGLPTEATGDRHALFYSARRVVQALAAAQPTVLVFGDLHWADPSLLDLIELLAARVEDAPLLLLAAARPELRKLQGPQLALEPLTAAESRELAERLGAGDAAAIGVAGEGNPLFIEELVAHVAEGTGARRELPTSIRGIIAARLDAIPPDERSLLLTASVAGRVFWDGALGSEGSLTLLDALEGRDLIRREPVSRLRGQRQFRFKHALICDVAYAALPRSRRRAAHAAVAAFFEEMGEPPGTLAHHWRAAGENERALRNYVAAADTASRGWAKEEAVELYRQALALVPEDDGATRGKLRMRLAVADQMTYHLRDAERLTPGRAQAPAPPPADPAA